MTQNSIFEEQHRTVSSSLVQNVTVETFDSLAKVCIEQEALEFVSVYHCSGFPFFDIRSRNVIVEMYSICGSVDDALGTWCVMMRCFAKSGYSEAAIDLFNRFKQEGNKPDGDIFKEVFAACTLTGDVDEGSLQFQYMCRDCRIVPSIPEDTSHSETKIIYETLMSLRSQLKEMGYVPDTRFYCILILVMENKERAYGYKEEVEIIKRLLNSRPRSSIKDGVCQCNNYW
ncbi:hypothetical protein CARUB_v10011942mg [Capsella rubella]|uniref:Pentacotripeptide-repeat region of PRORP domain-containing protein n=1 Tax=Capsella rubella TaxID=81985 RepID=R0IGV1_9BRAS|nr:hypothetical protein CARUB_v10011942mg [Capsella rubella]